MITAHGTLLEIDIGLLNISPILRVTYDTHTLERGHTTRLKKLYNSFWTREASALGSTLTQTNLLSTYKNISLQINRLRNSTLVTILLLGEAFLEILKDSSRTRQ